jgi:ATP-dependent helicase HrpA
MMSLHLGEIAQFPFLEAPSGRAISDGIQLLQELGAVDEERHASMLRRFTPRVDLVKP